MKCLGEVKWMVGRRSSTRGETRQTEEGERIRNRRAGSRSQESRAQGRRATNRSRRPTRLAQLGDSFGPSLKLLHARRSWRSFKPCAKAARCATVSRKKETSLHDARDAHLQIEHPIQASLASPGTTPQNAADMYLTKIMQAHYRCHDRVDG